MILAERQFRIATFVMTFQIWSSFPRFIGSRMISPLNPPASPERAIAFQVFVQPFA